MGDTVEMQMISLLMKSGCCDENVKKGLLIAYNIILSSGYYNLDDWVNMSYEEQLEEVKSWL